MTATNVMERKTITVADLIARVDEAARYGGKPGEIKVLASAFAEGHGVRLTGMHHGHTCDRVVPWSDIERCEFNPLLREIDTIRHTLRIQTADRGD